MPNNPWLLEHKFYVTYIVNFFFLLVWECNVLPDAQFGQKKTPILLELELESGRYNVGAEN